MIQAFKTRRPWAAAIMGGLCSPVIGMCYLNKGKLALVYLGMIIAIIVLLSIGAQHGIVEPTPLLKNSIGVMIIIIGASHCFLVARKYSSSKPVNRYARWYVLVLLAVLLNMIPYMVKTYLFAPFHIPASSISMNPNILPGDFFFVKKFSYNWFPPARGDIVVFKNKEASFVKRIIGLPGEKIQIKESIVYINDIPLSHTEQGDYKYMTEKKIVVGQQFLESLPEGAKYNIIEASINAPQDTTDIYIVPSESYFVLGDNRDHSNDSRHHDIGFVSRKDIAGKIIESYN